MKPQFATVDTAFGNQVSHGENGQKTRRKDDVTRQSQDETENQKQLNYMLTNESNKAMDRQQYLESMSNVGTYQKYSGDAYGTHVDQEGALFNGSVGNKIVRTKAREMNALDTRPFLPHPNRTFNRTSIINPDTHSKIITGRYTTMKKSNNTLAGISTDHDFLIQSPVKQSIDYHNKNLNNMVRGGSSTRSYVKNVDYIRYLQEKTKKNKY